jgi:polyhydroxyalkanoate synthase
MASIANQTFSSEPIAYVERFRKFTELLSTEAPIAQTPKEVVWTLNKAKLYRYTPVLPEEERHKLPLLLVFALINRPSILDLRPGHSFVEFMVKSGYDVYLLDWGVPGQEDKNMKLDDYTLEYLPRAIRKLKSISGSREFSMLGWCVGALLTTIYAAMLPDDGLRNLLLLTAPLDFSNRDALTLARLTDEKYFDLDRILAVFGNMPGHMIDFGSRVLKPVENYITNYYKLWDNLDDPSAVESWHAMNTWMSDFVPVAGGAYRQLIDDLYRNNRLIKNELQIGGKIVDLGRLRANLLTVIAERDHITPPCQSESILDKVSSADKEIFRVQGGHVGVMAGGRTAPTITWPHIDAWLGARSAEETKIRSRFKYLGPQERHVQPHLNSAHSPIPSCSTRTLELVAPLAIR